MNGGFTACAIVKSKNTDWGAIVKQKHRRGVVAELMREGENVFVTLPAQI